MSLATPDLVPSESPATEGDVVQDLAACELDTAGASPGDTDSQTSSEDNNIHDNSPGRSDTASDSALVPDIPPLETASEKRFRNPFVLLRQRLSDGGGGGRQAQQEREKKEQLKTKSKLDRILRNVTVESLPQSFVVKYLGCRQCKGLYGLRFTREPVEALVSEITKVKRDLALVNVQVTTKGLLLAPHKASLATVPSSLDMGLLPIEFISYGVQDIKYTRIFSYIVVREMSSKTKVLECHAVLCDSMVTARKMALAVSFAFNEYAKTLEGKPYKFKVDLQDASPASGASEDSAAAGQEEVEDCEA